MPSELHGGDLLSTLPRLSLIQNTLSNIQGQEGSPASNGAPILIWIIDQEGYIQFLEGDFPLDVSLTSGEGVGQSLLNVLEKYPDVVEKVRSSLKGKTSRFVTQNGGQLWEWHIYSLTSQQSKSEGALGFTFDLSSRGQSWHQGALMDTAAALRKARSSEEMPPLIVEQLEQLLSVERAALVLGSPPELNYSWGDWDDDPGIVHELGKTLTDPELISRLSRDNKKAGPSLPRELNSIGIQGFPLIAHKEVLGALWLGRQEPFDDVEIRLIYGITEMAASAIQRSGEHALTQRRLEHLAALRSIDQAISGSFDLNLTLNIIIDKVVSQLDVDAAAVFLVDSDTLEPRYAEGTGFRHYQPLADIGRTREDLVWRVLQKRELVTLPDLMKAAPTLSRGKMFATEGFRSYYGIPLIAKGKILGVLEVFHRRPLQVDREWFDFLRGLGTQAAIAMDNAALVENLRRTNLKLDLAYNTTLEGWVRALDMRDKTTGDHTQRVVEYTLKLIKAVDVPDQQLIHIRRGALLHDIGKLGVPDNILNKPGQLNEEEWALMKKHPIYAMDYLEPIEFLRPALPIPYGHHEKWDGSGYPLGARGTQIPIEARVFALIDVWDALKSPRPYRDAWPENKVNQYIKDQAGTHFDPQVVDIWAKVFQIPD